MAVICGTLVALTKTKRVEHTVAQSGFVITATNAADETSDEFVTEAGMEDLADSSPADLKVDEVGESLGATKGERHVFSAALEDSREKAPSVHSSGRDVSMQSPRNAAQSDLSDSLKMAGGGPSGGGQRSNQAAAGSDPAPANGVFSGGFAGGRSSSPPASDFSTLKNIRQYDRDAGGSENRAPGMTAAMRREEARKSWAHGLQGNEQFDRAKNNESYSPLVENPFRKPTEYPLSTFSTDVDTASYTNVRRFLNAHAMPPADAVRIEELINYFQYAYPQPQGDQPFFVTTYVADCPWNTEHRLLRVGLKGREVAAETRPASNLVFLLDVSGSMQAPNKLPLVKEAMSLLTEKLTENDRVAIVVYAGSSGLALPPTNGANKAAIHAAIAQLEAGGSTNGGQGLQMAYDTAQSQFIEGGTNRVILATDGDFNVGVINQDDLVKLVADKAKHGVYLTALGFGMGNLKDGTLEKLADKGNGNYAYIDTLAEARRVLVEQLTGTLVTIAKDVKLQIEFNPAQAAAYRLIGYENRILPPQDFHDDRKDAGEIGAGHTVTALYEIVPTAAADDDGPLKYQPARPQIAVAKAGELATIQLRYKDPEAAESRLIEHVVTGNRPLPAFPSGDFQFAAAVAEFGMLLRDSPYRGTSSYKSVLALAEQGLGSDLHGYRSEFIEIVRKARDLSGKP